MRMPQQPSRNHVRELGPKRLDLGTANPSSHALLSGELWVTRTAMVHARHARGQVSFPFGDIGRGDAVKEVTAASQEFR